MTAAHAYSATHSYATALACALHGHRALIVPDVRNNSLPHWQSLWERAIPGATRIRLQDWQSADWVKWRNSIIASLISIDAPVVVIAEGFGALAAASVAAEYPSKIIAALLVNPADPASYELGKKIPRHTLPVATEILLRPASQSSANTAAEMLAQHWGAGLSHSAASDTAADYWPEAISLLSGLVAKTQRDADAMTEARTRKLMAYLRALKKAHSAHRLQAHYS